MINFDFLLRGMGYYKKELPPKKPKTREIKNIQQKRKRTNERREKKEQNPEIKIKQEMSRQTKSKM